MKKRGNRKYFCLKDDGVKYKIDLSKRDHNITSETEELVKS